MLSYGDAHGEFNLVYLFIFLITLVTFDLPCFFYSTCCYKTLFLFMIFYLLKCSNVLPCYDLLGLSQI